MQIGTAVEPFHEKNNNVKPACHKIYQGRYHLLIFSSFCVLLYLIPSLCSFLDLCLGKDVELLIIAFSSTLLFSSFICSPSSY